MKKQTICTSTKEDVDEFLLAVERLVTVLENAPLEEKQTLEFQSRLFLVRHLALNSFKGRDERTGNTSNLRRRLTVLSATLPPLQRK